MTQPNTTRSNPTENSGRFICTQVDPWTPERGRAAHPDAIEVSEQVDGWPGGDIVTYSCPWCHKRWREELPQ